MSVSRHLSFGSTFRFDKVRQQVNTLTGSTGRLAYANYDPSLGEPPTEEQKELLQSYKPVLPVLTFVGSEKLHGENMAVCFSRGTIWVQGRNHIRTIEADQNGMAHFVEEHKVQFQELFDNIVHDYQIDPQTYTIVLDGEWAGGNIQKGNAACSDTDKAFYIFDYFRVVSNDTDDSQYKSTEGLNVFPSKSIYLMKSFGSYELVLDFNKPLECEEQLKAVTLQVEEHSPIAKYFGKPDNVGEGLYLWCVYNDNMLRLKSKGDKHGGKPKSPKLTKDIKTPEEITMLQVLADKVTPVWRITQAITETNATELKHLGEVIKWVIGDVSKEEVPTLTEAGVELKTLSRFISAEVKLYYFEYLKQY